MLTIERLQSVLSYDEDTGLFTWLGGIRAEFVAGNLHQGGYINIVVDGLTYPAHVLAWFYKTGHWEKVDHKDRNKANNAINNLRPATTSQNNYNRRSWGILPKGIKLSRSGKYEARIHKNLAYIHLGTFSTIEEAKAAYKNAYEILAGEFVCAEQES